MKVFKRMIGRHGRFVLLIALAILPGNLPEAAAADGAQTDEPGRRPCGCHGATAVTGSCSEKL